MVALHTNRPEYENDIAEVIRAHLGFVQISQGVYEDGYAIEAILKDGQALARGEKSGTEHSASYPINEFESELLKKRAEKRALKIAVYRVMQALEPGVNLPWGALTGIRPTKLLRELMETEGEKEALRLFTNDFGVDKVKADLAKDIVGVQRPIIKSAGDKDVDVYIGIPFCRTRCLYCSFASETAKSGVPNDYIDALYKDIEMGARIAKEGGYGVRAMYMGGGTPTVLLPKELARLIDHALNCYGGAGKELTVEAGRPDTIDKEKLIALKNTGVTRICLNPQSMNNDTLSRIGRAHTPEEFIEAFYLARDAGFDNINTDIIAGLPGETTSDFLNTLDKVERLCPDSLTVHTLAIKRSSRLKERLDEHTLPSPEETEKMTRQGGIMAEKLNMRPYYMYRQKYVRGNLENVGYAKEGMECVYNIDMMEEAVNILAHGAGAMSKRVYQGRNQRVERVPAPKDIKTYEKKLTVLDEKKRSLFLE